MIELQKFIKELKAEKRNAFESSKIWEERGNEQLEYYYLGAYEGVSLAITKAELLLKKTREQQP